jgi:hypothetical protein
MAYMNQEKKKKIAAELKKSLAGTGLKYTLAVNNYSTLVMNIQSGPVDFLANAEAVAKAKPREMFGGNLTRPKAIQVNTYWYQDHFTGEALELLKKIVPVMNTGNHDRSDIQSDYFDVGWYVNVNIGQWNKPYQVTK